jgi:hypothetical protein
MSAQLESTRHLVAKLSASVMGLPVAFIVETDRKRPADGRVFIQCSYQAACTVTGKDAVWKGRKWYLSDHMTPDEVVKTCYAAFKAAVEHEVMEGFHFDGQRVFNPHTPFQTLIRASLHERYRDSPIPCALCDRGDGLFGHSDECPKSKAP